MKIVLLGNNYPLDRLVLIFLSFGGNCFHYFGVALLKECAAASVSLLPAASAKSQAHEKTGRLLTHQRARMRRSVRNLTIFKWHWHQQCDETWLASRERQKTMTITPWVDWMGDKWRRWWMSRMEWTMLNVKCGPYNEHGAHIRTRKSSSYQHTRKIFINQLTVFRVMEKWRFPASFTRHFADSNIQTRQQPRCP